MVNSVRVNDNHGRDFHPLADHIPTLKKKVTFSVSTVTYQILNHLIVCLMISHIKHRFNVSLN